MTTPQPNPQALPANPQQLAVQQQQQALARVFDIGVGEYDVVIDMQQSFKTRQQQEAAWYLGLVQAEPSLMAVAGDIIVRAQESPGSQELADRLKKALPPNLQDDNDPNANLQQAQAQLQQLSQQHQLLVQELNKAHDIIQSKQIENDVKIKVALIDKEKAEAVAEITTKAQNEMARMRFEHEAFLAMHDAGHEAGMQAEDHAQAQTLADQQAANASAQSSQDAAQTQVQQATQTEGNEQ